VAYAISGESRRWPEGVVPYEISPDFSENQARTVARAIARWNRKTIMRLRRRLASDDDFVIFAPAEDICQSPVGRQGGGQTIGCAVGDSFTAGSVIHEIGHSVGYFHEQQRPDRDQFVDIREENIEAGKEGNFDIRMGGVILGP
jgi:Astacin (Peptidase family M12A)